MYEASLTSINAEVNRLTYEIKRVRERSEAGDVDQKAAIDRDNNAEWGGGVARNYILSLIWRCYGPKRDILDYWETILYWLLSY